MRLGVVGGGLIGAALANGLHDQGHEVVLVDRSAPAIAQGRLGLDVRNVALNPQSQACLAELGVWSDAKAAMYTGMLVWEEWGQGRIHFEAREIGAPWLGWIVENSPLQCELWHRFAGEICLGQVEDIVVKDDQTDLQINVEGSGATTLSCDFVFAVDGAQSPLRAMLDLPMRLGESSQVGLVSLARTEKPHEGIARQRFLREGPLALLPSLDPFVVSIVWTQLPESARRRQDLSDDAFGLELEDAAEHILGSIQAVDQRFSIPLQQRLLTNPLVRGRVLFLGDAARVVHPLAGLGANLGFEDVLDVLAVTAGRDEFCGRIDSWAPFVRRHRTRGQHMLNLLGGLNDFYRQMGPWATWIRNLGVAAFDLTKPLKHQVMREAMGVGPISRAGGGG